MMLEIIRWVASITAIVAAITVSGNFGRLVTAWGFVIFTASSLSWILVGVLDEKPALLTQNAVLTAVNLFGVYRWFEWKSRE